jgi:ribonuclease-3
VREGLAALEERLGHRFADRGLLVRALTHASFANEADGEEEIRDNETLEFLGDSVLGYLVAERLFAAFPAWGQGELSKARSELVSETSFADRARGLGLGPLLRLSPGEERAGGRERSARLADAFEAVIAALALDGGLPAARDAVDRLFGEAIASLDLEGLAQRDSKSALQERAQAEGRPLPSYRLVSESGPDHDKVFVYEVVFGGATGLRATGTGPSKKEAQRAAARAALDLLNAKGA